MTYCSSYEAKKKKIEYHAKYVADFLLTVWLLCISDHTTFKKDMRCLSTKLRVVVHVILAHGRLRQEDQESKATWITEQGLP